MAEEESSSRFGKKRSKILYQITGLIVALLVVAGLVMFFFIDNAFDRLIEKSVDKLVEEQAKTITNALEYMAGQEVELVLGEIMDYDPQELIAMFTTSFQEGEMNEVQMKGNERLKEWVETGVLGLEMIIEVTLAMPPVISETTVVSSSDESFVFGTLPDSIDSAIEEGKSYVYFEDGLPELGLEGEYLVSLYDMSQVSSVLSSYWGVHFVPMQDAVAEIESFYNDEKNRATLIIASILGGTILIVILITFFVLSFLIRKQITEPIDELSAAAEEVMEGNLDVEIEVREGEEFEGLKRTFKEMVESIRRFIAKSTGEE